MAGGAVLELVRKAVVPTLCLMVSAYFLHHAVMGPTGVLALADIRARTAALEAEARALQAERARLEGEIALLDPRGADPDFAEELVRRHLGVARPDEVIVPLPETGSGAGE
jgi:cell division protein FtsB